MHRLVGERMLMRIHIGESDKHEGRPLYQVIVEMLREKGFAGATVLRGMMGFGPNARLHSDHVLRLSSDLPIVIECVDTEEKIREIIPGIDDMMGGGR